MEIIVHTMEYSGEAIHSPLILRNYLSSDYSQYQEIYNECFSDAYCSMLKSHKLL